MEALEINSLSAIDHLLQYAPHRIKQIIVTGRVQGRIEQLVQLAREHKIAVDIGGRAKTDSSEPLRALLFPFRYVDFRQFLSAIEDRKEGVILALDHLQDPQNFGALCRTAEGLGVLGVVIPKDRSVAVSRGVYHASVGAVETIPIVQVTNLGESLRRLKEKNFWVIGTTLGETATAPWEMPGYEKSVLVLGSELEGMSPGIEKICDWKIKLPLKGKIQSLNVSAAGAILLYELTRQILKKSP